jgi:anti-sigma B factor antagonist
MMKITVKDIQGVCLMAISGRVDSNSSFDLESALYEAIDKNSRVIMDLADTAYMSSSGLRVLLAGKKMLKARSGEIILTSLQPVVRDVFEIAGLTRLFSIKKSREDALCELKCQQ